MDLLVSYRADMVATNKEGLTPADLAKAKNHEHIATSLEAKMVFFVSVYWSSICGRWYIFLSCVCSKTKIQVSLWNPILNS